MLLLVRRHDTTDGVFGRRRTIATARFASSDAFATSSTPRGSRVERRSSAGLRVPQAIGCRGANTELDALRSITDLLDPVGGAPPRLIDRGFARAAEHSLPRPGDLLSRADLGSGTGASRRPPGPIRSNAAELAPMTSAGVPSSDGVCRLCRPLRGGAGAVELLDYLRSHMERRSPSRPSRSRLAAVHVGGMARQRARSASASSGFPPVVSWMSGRLWQSTVRQRARRHPESHPHPASAGGGVTRRQSVRRRRRRPKASSCPRTVPSHSRLVSGVRRTTISAAWHHRMTLGHRS